MRVCYLSKLKITKESSWTLSWINKWSHLIPHFENLGELPSPWQSVWQTVVSKVGHKDISHPKALLTMGLWHSSHWWMGAVYRLPSGRAWDSSGSNGIWRCIKKGNAASAWLSWHARSWNPTSCCEKVQELHGTPLHRCPRWQPLLRAHLLASISLQTCEWESFPVMMAPSIKWPPPFESSQQRPQTPRSLSYGPLSEFLSTESVSIIKCLLVLWLSLGWFVAQQ